MILTGLKRLARAFPLIGNLHEERNRYARELDELKAERARIDRDLVQANKNSEQLKNIHELLLQRELDCRIRDESISNLVVECERKLDESVRTYKSIADDLIADQRVCADTRAEIGNEALMAYFSKRGLFVVGHARSGTSILIDALNTSDEIYCLTEAFFYLNQENTDFSRVFNNIQKGNGNPIYKSTYAPDVGDIWSVLKHLSTQHKYVGEKLAFRLNSIGYDIDAFFSFSNKYFSGSHYICVVRDPLDVIASNLSMFSSSLVNDESLSSVVTSQLETYRLIINLAKTLSNVYLLQHETIDQSTFDTLSTYLGCSMNRAGALYFKGGAGRHRAIINQIMEREDTRLLQHAHLLFLSIFDKDTLKISDDYAAILYLQHIENEIKRRTGIPSIDRYGIFSLADELEELRLLNPRG